MAHEKREPCPDRFLDDVGSMFAASTVCGSVFHFIKGHGSSPAGHRLSGAVQAVRMNVPRFSGGSVAWAALYCVFDCSMVYIRMKEDHWNSIIAASATAGILFMPYGPIPAAGSALSLAAVSALAEAAIIRIDRSELGSLKEPETTPMLRSRGGEGSSSWFGRIFGGRTVDPKAKDLFDSPVSSFKYK